MGGREAGKVVDRLKEKDVAVVLRLDFPDEPKVPSEAEYRKRDLADREEPLRVLANSGGAAGRSGPAPPQRWPTRGCGSRSRARGSAKAETFHAQVRKAIAAGLSPEAAVDALTRRAAEIAGIGDRLGTIEPGKLGHLVVLTAPYGGENGQGPLRPDRRPEVRPREARPRRRGQEAAAASAEESPARRSETRAAAGPRPAQEGKPAETPDAGPEPDSRRTAR